MRNIAIIPDRKNSKGLKKKNRILIDGCLKFITKIKWFNQIIISSDDSLIINKAKENNLDFIKRSKKLSTGNISIKSVMIDVVKKKN